MHTHIELKISHKQLLPPKGDLNVIWLQYFAFRIVRPGCNKILMTITSGLWQTEPGLNLHLKQEANEAYVGDQSESRPDSEFYFHCRDFSPSCLSPFLFLLAMKIFSQIKKKTKQYNECMSMFCYICQTYFLTQII